MFVSILGKVYIIGNFWEASMRLDDERESSNVEDYRDRTGGTGFSGLNGLNLLGLLGQGKGGLIIIVIIVVGAFLGFDLTPMLNGQMPVKQGSSQPRVVSAEEQELKTFAFRVLNTTERIWGAYFKSQGRTYQPPTLRLYRNSTSTACGYGRSASGPFYCPADNRIYLDLSFYDDMKKQLKASGDFAFAYVIAHEVGHHVQNLLGTSAKSQQAQRRSSKTEANRISVAVELQADCYAGVWAYYVQRENRLDSGDVEEAFRAAEAVGDDRLQEQSGGQVVPDSFTHGSSAQRLAWFRRGLQSGNPSQCNTFRQGKL